MQQNQGTKTSSLRCIFKHICLYLYMYLYIKKPWPALQLLLPRFSIILTYYLLPLLFWFPDSILIHILFDYLQALSKIACNRLQKELVEWQVNPPVGFKHKVTDDLQRFFLSLFHLIFFDYFVYFCSLDYCFDEFNIIILCYGVKMGNWSEWCTWDFVC